MELEFNKTDTDRKEKYLQNGLKWLCYLAGNSKRTCFFTIFSARTRLFFKVEKIYMGVIFLIVTLYKIALLYRSNCERLEMGP